MELHIARDGEQYGPFPLEEVRRQLAAGTLLPTDLAWAAGRPAWVPLGSLPMIASASATAPPPAVPAPKPPTLAPPPRTAGPARLRPAVTSLICGILSVTVLPGLAAIVAIICGHVARGGIRKSAGTLRGDGMAAAGLVTGYFGIGFMLLAGLAIFAAVFSSGMALPLLGDWRLREKETKSMSNAKAIVANCHLYAQDHHGIFPNKLEDLIPKYLPDLTSLSCPLSPNLPSGLRIFWRHRHAIRGTRFC